MEFSRGQLRNLQWCQAHSGQVYSVETVPGGLRVWVRNELGEAERWLLAGCAEHMEHCKRVLGVVSSSVER